MNARRGKLLLAVGTLAFLSGCASIAPPTAPSLELPRPPSDLHAARKGDKVTLTWTIPVRTMEHQSVKYLGNTQICRGVVPTLKECGTPVGAAPRPPDFTGAKPQGKKPTASFTDALPSALEQESPLGFATYAVEVLNEAKRGAGLSNQIHVALVPTELPFASFAAQTTAQGVLISWQCPTHSSGPAGVKYLFRIYRHPVDSTITTKIAELPATDCVAVPAVPASHQPGTAADVLEKIHPVTSFLDETIEWEKTYFYRGTVVSVVESPGKPPTEIEGDDTPEVKIFADDIFPPAVPSGLQAVFSGPGQQPFIDLIWGPVTDADLAGYNVYRHEEGAATIKLNPELVKTPAFRDMRVAAGKTYSYAVSAVDQRGNESERSQEASESVPQ